MQDETLHYGAHETWFSAFLKARTSAARLKVLAQLPPRLSGGWRATVERAAAHATADGHNIIAARLTARKVDKVTDDGTACTDYVCSDCGHIGPARHFGPRNMDRTVRVDEETGRPVFLPHWTVTNIEEPRNGKVRISIRCRQNACRACRATCKPGVKAIDGKGWDIAPRKGTEDERAAYWARNPWDADDDSEGEE